MTHDNSSVGEPNGSAQKLEAYHESWPLLHPFAISRGTKSEANVIVVTASNGHAQGRGEAVPYHRYNETIDSALSAITALPSPIDRADLNELMPAGAARNAVDCALWDLEARIRATSVAQLIGRQYHPVTTAYTISLAAPHEMAARALEAKSHGLLKLKLGATGDTERMAAVRAARPDARLIVDANEGWSEQDLPALVAAAHQHGIELIEQPLPANRDDILTGTTPQVPLCADESLHTLKDLERVASRYQAINIKLDKTGGLSHALQLTKAAQTMGLKIMVGSMVATSLAVAPALLLTEAADWVDLDGPLLLKNDRKNGLSIANGIIAPPSPSLWGGP